MNFSRHITRQYATGRGIIEWIFVCQIAIVSSANAVYTVLMQKHTWREETEEGTKFFRATHHGGRWTYATQMRGEDEWTQSDPIQPEEWQEIRDMLWNKYQRGRCPWGFIEKIDKILAKENQK
ncbi:hypothetical protein [Persicirhabdus sediminis]|nr:hypothetical protein [Persicirhabdus sediminis]